MRILELIFQELKSFDSVEALEQCRRRIGLVVASCRQKAQFTHFISIPLASVDIRQSFNVFKQKVQECPQIEVGSKFPYLSAQNCWLWFSCKIRFQSTDFAYVNIKNSLQAHTGM